MRGKRRQKKARVLARAESNVQGTNWRRQFHYSAENGAVQYRRTTVSICFRWQKIQIYAATHPNQGLLRRASVNVLPEP